MKRFVTQVTIASLSFSYASSTLATASSFLDAYYVPFAEVSGAGPDLEEGDGYGLKGRGMLGEDFFLSVEYMNNEYEPFEITFVDGVLGEIRTEHFEVEIETFRVGLGTHFPESPAYVRGEYIGYEAEISTTGSEDDEAVLGSEDREDGYGAYVGVLGRYGERIWFQAEVGYVDINDVGGGAHFLAGAGFDFARGFGLFTDARSFQLREDGDQFEFNDLRVGLRMSFM